MELTDVTILKRKVELTPRTKDSLKGLTIGEKLSYQFYDGSYQGAPLLFAQPRKGNPTPKECRITADRISNVLGLLVVFILGPGPTYERQRLADKGVYFIMSDKYAHLPMLIALEKTSNRKKVTTLTPVAQYILLYHLQVKSLEGLSAKEIAELIPYSYESTALGLTCLDDLGLAKKMLTESRTKVLQFSLNGKALWNKAQKYLSTPVTRRFYCDNIKSEATLPICGINALAHFTALNPDAERMLMLTDKEYRTLKASDAFENPNEYDGDLIIEVWKYPAVKQLGEPTQWIDRLSLALSLKLDNDPRVEKEVERMIEEIEW